MARKTTISSLKKKLDRVFSLYIRTKSSTNGYVRCYTCNILKPIKEMQAGHFVGRVHHGTRWEEKNVKPQCSACNIWKEGNKDIFAIELIKEYGDGILKELNQKRNTIVKHNETTYNKLIDYFTKKLNDLI